MLIVWHTIGKGTTPGQKKRAPEGSEDFADFVFVHASEGFPVAAEKVGQLGIVSLDGLAGLVGDLVGLALQIGSIGDQGADHVGDFGLGSVVTLAHEVGEGFGTVLSDQGDGPGVHALHGLGDVGIDAVGDLDVGEVSSG